MIAKLETRSQYAYAWICTVSDLGGGGGALGASAPPAESMVKIS